MMSEVVLQVKNLNNGILPRINLIGHSRGGITNMQYALDHPDMVASLYSFGTPYLGTTVAELDINNADGSVGELLLGDGALGEKDLANPEIYMKLVNRWNNNYDNLYSRIRCMALGGKTSISYLSEFIKYGLRTVLEEMVSDYLNVLGEDAYNKFIYLIISLADEIALSIVTGVAVSSIPLSIVGLETLIRPLLSKMDPETSAKWAKFLDNLDNLIYGIIDIISSEIKINLFTNESTIVWESDVVVNIESQLASRVINGNLVSYKGFSSHCVTFTPPKEEKVDGITHVKEVYNKKLQEYLIRDLKPLYDWGYYKLDDNNICITGYYGEYPEQGVLDIPSELSVNGKIYTVASIGEYAFADDCYGIGINTYIIPSTITEIGDYAFENCISMKCLNTANATSLKR